MVKLTRNYTDFENLNLMLNVNDISKIMRIFPKQAHICSLIQRVFQKSKSASEF